MNALEIPKIPSITETAEKIKAGNISSEELVNEHLKRAHYVQDQTNSFITILDGAIEQAKVVDGKIKNGEKVGKLAGIPFTLKDLYLVKGTRTTFGSKITEDFVAPYTSTVVQKLLDEDAILIGKCNCDPWGFGGSGENSGYGPTKHPLDLTRTPGGSSSGSAASLLAGVGFFSLGTDTGGSVRQPASLTGLYGLKPTYGRNSRYGIGAMASSFDTPGFFARNLNDIVMIQKIIEGKDSYDPTTQEIETKNYDLTTKKKYRIGVPKEFYGEGLDPEIKQIIEEKINEYKNAGHEIVDVSIPSMKYGIATYYVLVPSEISSNRARYDGVRYGKKVSDEYFENMVKSRGTFFEDEVKRRIMVGTFALSAGYSDQFYKKATQVRNKLRSEFNEAFSKVDLMISPVSPTTAFKLGENSDDPVKMYLLDVYTVTANLVGIPSLAVPIKNHSNGLPVGMQIMANHFDEEKIFNFLSQ